jgi:hypothetical protein
MIPLGLGLGRFGAISNFYKNSRGYSKFNDPVKCCWVAVYTRIIIFTLRSFWGVGKLMSFATVSFSPVSLLSATNYRRWRWYRRQIIFFVYLYSWARVCWPLLCLCRPFCIFKTCLDSNPESCRSKQARFPSLVSRTPAIIHDSWKKPEDLVLDSLEPGSWSSRMARICQL